MRVDIVWGPVEALLPVSSDPSQPDWYAEKEKREDLEKQLKPIEFWKQGPLDFEGFESSSAETADAVTEPKGAEPVSAV